MKLTLSVGHLLTLHLIVLACQTGSREDYADYLKWNVLGVFLLVTSFSSLNFYYCAINWVTK